MLQDSGFTDVVIGDAVDTFGGAKGQDNARAFDVYGYAFMARRPPEGLHSIRLTLGSSVRQGPGRHGDERPGHACGYQGEDDAAARRDHEDERGPQDGV